MSKQRRGRSKPFWTVDCETDPFKAGRTPVPFIWGVYSGDSEEYYEFATAAEVVSFFEDKNVLVYAHNGGKFDYHYMRDFINSDEPIMMVAGRMARFKIGAAEFRDSINILVNPLRAFAKDEMDYTKMEPAVRNEHMEEIRKYLRSDCVNLWNTVHAYFSRFGRTLTQAGASMRYWKKHYKYPMRPQTATQSVKFREFYYGGRVQCFKQGHCVQQFKVLDINSAYPYAMLHKHPISPDSIVRTELPHIEEMGEVMVRLRAVAKGCFPIRSDDRSLFFPEDEKTVREYFVTGWELKTALELDLVKIFEVKEVHYFVDHIDFKDYISHFYEERKIAKVNQDRMGDTFAKLFMNSLYGKFAADPAKYREYVISSDDSIEHWLMHTKPREGCLHCKMKDPAGDWIDSHPWGTRRLLERKLPEEKHRYYNVATAASITGFVRAYLLQGLSACRDVLYCDTDSIAAGVIGNLPMGGELGQWKLEKECIEYAIAGKKLYAFKSIDETWKTACKGVKLTPEQIVSVAQGKTVIYDPEVPTYSLFREQPTFMPRVVKSTGKDITKMLS